MYNGNGELRAKYTYDAWGNVTSITDENGNAITSKTHVGNLNPFRYRGYYQDTETGFYYLMSRYYDTVTHRFVNADGYFQTGSNILDVNMNIYCRNNPVMYTDPTGESWEEIGVFLAGVAVAVWAAMVEFSPAYAGCAGLAAADGPLPFGDALGVIGAVVITAVAVGRGIYQATQTAPSISVPQVKEKEKTASPPNKVPVTKIYRYGGTNPGNLTPRAKDKTGLSFSTVPLPGAAMTTMEALNATGVVYAVRDGGSHVSVRPVNGTMDDWINEGSSSIWTKAVKSVVVKWDGTYFG